MTIYQHVVVDLKSAIAKYKNGDTSLDSLKSVFWRAASEIVLIEEKEFRLTLQQAEAELDSLQYTVDDELLFDETLEVVNRIESYLIDV